MIFHPSPAPEGRGPYPLVGAILEQRSIWAVTCRRINEKFDQGAILDAENFRLDPDEYHESLRLKTQMAVGRLAARVADGFESLGLDNGSCMTRECHVQFCERHRFQRAQKDERRQGRCVL